MNISQFELLTQIAQTGSFTEAAQKVGLTQSAASRAISRLEDELGVVLLERGHGRVELTAVGQDVMPHISGILNHLECIRQETLMSRGLHGGKLRLGIYTTLSPRLLTGILGAFRSRYPGIEVATLAGTVNDMIDWVQKRVVDIAFVHERDLHMDKVLIAEDEMLVVLPHTFKEKNPLRLTPHDLQHEALIASRADCKNLIDTIFAQAGTTYRQQFDVEDTSTMIAMIEEGLGYGIVPALNLPEDYSDLKLVRLDPPVYRQLYLGVKHLEGSAPAVRAFMELAHTWAQRKGYFSSPEK
jgi:molybdate transport repressor ModE-like protein